MPQSPHVPASEIAPVGQAGSVIFDDICKSKHEGPKLPMESLGSLPLAEEEWQSLRNSLRQAAERHLLEQERLVARALVRRGSSDTRSDCAFSTPSLSESTPSLHSSRPSLSSSVLGSAKDEDASPTTLCPMPLPTWPTLPAFHAPRSGLQKDMQSLEENLEAEHADHLPGFFGKLWKLLMKWDRLFEEPRRSGTLYNIIKSRLFELITVMVILANVVFIVITTDYAMQHLNREPMGWMQAAEMFFLSFYTAELALRLAVHRLYFFTSLSGWNMFDLTLVCISLFDFFLTLHSQSKGVSLTFLRLCRILKIGKTIRIFRALSWVKELRLMVDLLIGAVSPLFWAALMLLVILGLFSIFFIQNVANYLSTYEGVHPQEEKFIEFFGNVRTGMLTLFIAVTGGRDWLDSYVLLLETGPVAAAVFIVFIAFFVVAVWNIMTSIFMDKAIQLAKPDLETVIFEKKQNDIRAAQEVVKLIHQLDGDNNGRVSREGFLRYMMNPKFRTHLEFKGVDVKDAEVFFDMLSAAAETKEVPLGAFAAGCTKMTGHASAADLHSMFYENKILRAQHEQFAQFCTEQLEEIRSTLYVERSGEVRNAPVSEDLVPARTEVNLSV